MPDPFNRTDLIKEHSFAVKAADVFAAKKSADSSNRLLSQNVVVAYRHSLMRVYEMAPGSPAAIHLLTGMASGEMTLGRLIGPRILQAHICQNFSDVCGEAPSVLVFESHPEASGKSPRNFSVGNASVRSIALTTTVMDISISEQMFFGLETVDFDDEGA